MTKLRLNALTSVVFQFITLLSGLIIPKILLTAYGTQVNGLNYSISQLLSVITYFDFGVAAVAQAALYKPLYQKDYDQVSTLFNAVKRYFNRLTVGLLAYVLLLCLYYGITKADQFSWLYTSTLVIAISVSLIGQYVLGISNQVILAADQKIYIYTTLNILTILLNIVATFVLVKLGYSIQVVKLASSLIFIIRPLLLQVYVKKHYPLRPMSEVGYSPIPNQWSGLIQHVAVTLTSSLDTIVLTLLSTLGNVSIYNIYTFPLNGIRLLIESVCAGYKSYFGYLLAKGRVGKDDLEEAFTRFEWLTNLVAVVFTCLMYSLLVPFVLVYTRGVQDENYSHQTFALIMIVAYLFMSIKTPYTTVINAAGHFRETQSHSLIEIAINTLASVLLVGRLGLIGVAIGTCLAVLYRIIASILYLRTAVLNRSMAKNIKVLLIDALVLTLFPLLSSWIGLTPKTYVGLVLSALVYGLLALVLFLAASAIFFQKGLLSLLKPQKNG